MRCLIWVRAFEPGGAWAKTGSQPSQIPTTVTSTTPDTNSGTVESEEPVIVITRSQKPPLFRAAVIPASSASGMVITSATAMSFSEFTSASPTSSDTGRRRTYDSPRSPVTKLPTQSAYCVTSGRFTPSSSFSWSTAP